MKKYLILTLLFFLKAVVFQAQNNNNELLNSRIILAVVMPQNEEKIIQSNFSKIRSKITQMIANSGVGATDGYSNFYIYPGLEIYEEDVLDAGLQPQTIISGSLTFYIKQAYNNKLFGSYSVDFKGVGNSKSKAVRNGISKIKSNHPKFSSFISNVKSKIVTYYQNNCNVLVTEADKLARSNQYEKALVKLLAIPSGITSCDKNINSKVINVYKKYTNANCKSQMLAANSYYTSGDYTSTLQILRNVDPESVCKNESLSLMRKIESKINANDREAYKLTLKMYNDEISLKKMRIQAVKDIATSYYKNQPDNNLYIVK